MARYERYNALNDSHFPGHWEEEDFEFMAQFLRREFGAELVQSMNPEEEWDYVIYGETKR